MQNQSKNAKKNKRPLVFKPYLKGNALDGRAVRHSLRLMLYFLMFIFLYLIVGSALQFGGAVVRTLLNLTMVLICAMIVYMDGARLGEGEVAFGEICLARQESGNHVNPKDKERCYHPTKGWLIALIAAIPLVIITLPHAVTAVKQVYTLQSLPRWVASYGTQTEIVSPLSYYGYGRDVGVIDVLRMLSRVLVFPFANIATTDRPDMLLLVDRLSPVLASLPLLGFPLGYMTGPRSRAMIHGDIAHSNKRAQRKQKKAVKARRMRTEKKNELI